MEDKVLKLLIELGVVGEADAKAAANLVEDLGKQAGHAAAPVKELEGNSREFHKVASELNRVIPGLGEALMLLKHDGDSAAVTMIGMSMAIGALVEVNKKLAESAKHADEAMAALADEAGTGGALDAMKRAWEDADIAAEVYYRNLERNDADSVKKLAANRLEVLKRGASDAEKINEASAGVERAQVEAAEQDGVINHEQAAQAKFDIDSKYTAMRLQAQRDADAAQAQILNHEIANELGKVGAMAKTVADDQSKDRTAAGALAKHDDLISIYKGNINDAKAAAEKTGITPEVVEDLREAFEKYTGGDSANTPLAEQFRLLRDKMSNLTSGASWSPSLTKLMDFNIGPTGAPNLAAYELAENDQRRNKEMLTGENAKDYALLSNAANAKSDMDAAQNEQRELTKAIAELKDKISQVASSNAAAESTAGSTAFLKLTAEAIAGHNMNWQSMNELMTNFYSAADQNARDIDNIRRRMSSLGQ